MTAQNLLRSALAALVMGVAAGTGGCVALAVGAAAGVGGTIYIRGELRSTEEIPLDKMWMATLATIRELEFEKRSERSDALQGRVVARRADGSNVTIRLDADGSDRTKVGIRVGTFGDETVSRTILDKIKANAGRR